MLDSTWCLIVAETQVPLQNGTTPQSFLLPHELFSHMWEHYREAFAKIWMPGGESDISLSWSKFQHHPAMAGHPLFLTENWQSKAIPISIHGHGDAVPDSESVEASLAAEALQRDIGWAEDKELGPTAGKGKAWTKMLLVLSLGQSCKRRQCHTDLAESTREIFCRGSTTFRKMFHITGT